MFYRKQNTKKADIIIHPELNLKDKFSGVLKYAGENTKKFAVKLNQVERFTQKIEKGLLNVGKAAAAFGAVSIGAGIKSFADYDNAIRQVAASTGTSLKDMEADYAGSL